MTDLRVRFRVYDDVARGEPERFGRDFTREQTLQTFLALSLTEEKPALPQNLFLQAGQKAEKNREEQTDGKKQAEHVSDVPQSERDEYRRACREAGKN